MQCVLNLVFQYFIIYLLLWIYYTVEDFVGLDMSILAAAKDAIESAKATVQFAPMLSVLFVATRMRALQMTQNKGAPQGWVQDGMSACLHRSNSEQRPTFVLTTHFGSGVLVLAFFGVIRSSGRRHQKEHQQLS